MVPLLMFLNATTVYKFCLDSTTPRPPVAQLDKSKFWQLKRSRVPEKQIGIISGLEEVQAQEFAQMRRQIVHTPPYFEYDYLTLSLRSTRKSATGWG